MKYYVLNLLVAIFLGILIEGCSDLQTNIPPAEQKVSVHEDGFVSKTSANFHGNVIKQNNWDMKQCQQCHASNYSGGLTGTSCITCHTNPGGPEACNTCHGDFSNISRIAPPRATNGDTATTSIRVGAHTNHLYTATLGSQVACESCHKVPQSVYAQGHLDATPETIVSFAGVATANIASNAVFNSSDATCSNTYCHGNFAYKKSSAVQQNQFAFTDSVMLGNNATVTWTKVDGSQATCGSCHDLPPKGHIGPIPLTECYTCHGNVVDANGNIINPALHINGTADVRGSVVSGKYNFIR